MSSEQPQVEKTTSSYKVTIFGDRNIYYQEWRQLWIPSFGFHLVHLVWFSVPKRSSSALGRLLAQPPLWISAWAVNLPGVNHKPCGWQVALHVIYWGSAEPDNERADIQNASICLHTPRWIGNSGWVCGYLLQLAEDCVGLHWSVEACIGLLKTFKACNGLQKPHYRSRFYLQY